MAKDKGIGGFHVPEKVRDLSHRFCPSVHNFAVQPRELGGVALDDKHPLSEGAHRSANNFHTTTSGGYTKY